MYFEIQALYHHASVVRLHIRYRWAYFTLTVLDMDWHFFLSVYDVCSAHDMYGGKEKCMLGFSGEA